MDGAASWKQQYMDRMTAGLSRLLTDQKHTDMQVIIGDKTFDCHKVVLIAMSPYFDAMFSSGMKESLSGVVHMEGIDAEMFDSILKYTYHGCEVVGEENAEAMLKAASILQMDVLQKRCEDFLSKEINLGNCVSIWRTATLHDCANLEKSCKMFIVDNFETLVSRGDVLDFEYEELACLVKEDDLKCPNEEFVCDTVLQWVDDRPDERKTHIGDLFSHLRLPLIPPVYLVDLKDKEHVKNNSKCLQAIDAAKNFLLLAARRHDYSSKRFCHRKHTVMEDVLVVLSGGETPKPPYIRSTNVLAYSFKSRLWFHLAALPFDPGIEFASCVYDNDIFVSGGGMWMTSLLRYHSKKNKWTHSPAKLHFGRRRHAMVCVKNKVFVLGGFNSDLQDGQRVQSSIEEYDMELGEWELSGELQVAVSSLSAAVLGEKIFLFGGERNDKTDTANIQCYDTKTRTTTVISNLPKSCKLSRAVVCDGAAYVVMFDGKVIKYSYSNTIEFLGVIRTFERVHFGLVHRLGSLILLGGQEVRDNPNRPLCDTMIKYDLRTRTSTNLSDRIPTPRLLDSCAKITIHQKFLVEEDAS